MKIFLLDLWHDLRAKRLAPVAVVLLAGLVAVPVLLAKPAEEPAPAPVTAAPSSTTDRNKLAALAKVKLGEEAVGKGSTLGTFDPDNPFTPPKGTMKKDSAATAGPSGPSDSPERRRTRPPEEPARSGGGTIGGDTRLVALTGGGGTPAPQPQTTVYKYVVDLSFTANGRTRHIKGLEKLDMLPSDSSPLLIFMGVTPKGSDAVFLVDSTLEAAGEGRCKPSELGVRLRVHRRRQRVRLHREGQRRHLHHPDRGDPQGEGGRTGRRARRAPRPAPPSGRTAASPCRSWPTSWSWPATVSITPALTTKADRERAMRRISITCLTLVAAALLMLPAVASAQSKKRAKASTPQITRVQPMRISVGGTLTITGRNFKAKRTKNTVIFRASDGRTAFVKPRRATSRRLVLTVSASVARLLTVANSRQQPTRLKLRVLAGKFSKFTPKRLSPVVTATGDGDGTPGGPGGGGTVVCDSSPDHDGDLLSNSDELSVQHRPLPRRYRRRSDDGRLGVLGGQGPQHQGRPLPRRASVPERPGSDRWRGAGARFSSYDFDGDGLTTLEEYRAWRYTGERRGHEPARASASSRSSATATARSTAAPATRRRAPQWQSSNYGLRPTRPSRSP